MLVAVHTLSNYMRITGRSIYIFKNLNITQKLTENACRFVSTSMYCLSGARKFTDKHEWISIQGKIATIGLSHYAQNSLGDVVYVELPDVGAFVEQKIVCGALESVKAASELYCPVSGKVVEKNVSVEQTPCLINKSCYVKGWLFKVEMTKTDDLDGLMTETEYEKFLKTDGYQ